MVSSPQRSIEKPCRPSAYTVYHGEIYMSTFCDVGGGFFFCPSRLLVCGHQEWGWRGRSTPFEDDHRRRRNPLSTPAALWMVCVLSLPHDPHQKMQPLGQGSETTVSPKPSREAPGSEEGERSESLFRFRENLREYTGLPSRTTLNDVLLSGWGMSSLLEDVTDFFVSPYKPLSYTSLRGLVVYRRTTVVIESI